MRAYAPKRLTSGTAILAAACVGVVFAVVGVPTQQAKLTAADAADSDNFGFSVALAGDTAVVGALLGDAQQGAAYIFTRAGTAWTLQQKVIAADGAFADRFGISVAVFGDTAVVGASSAESAYVFTRTGNVWTQQQKIVADDPGAGDHFGYAVAIVGDTAVIGAYGQGAFHGAAYVFTRTGVTWTQQAKLTAVDAAQNDYFGQSVAISGDTAVVGAPEKNAFQGAAYVFTRAGTTWTQQAKLTSTDAADGDFFGISVAASGDIVVAGADAKGSARGSAYVFSRTGTAWTQQAILTASDVADGDQFGVSVALAGDIAVIGNATRSPVPSAVYVFTRAGAAWAQASKLTASDAEVGDAFGASVAIEGATAVVGANSKDSARGAAYVFIDLGPPPAGYCLATKVKAKAVAAHAEKSMLTASGTLDTGAGVPDFSGAATFDVGGFHLVVPAFAAKGKSLTYAGNGITLTITPAKNGSSHATFSAKAVGDLTGKVDLNGPLTFNFTNAAHNLNGAANLTAGALGAHAVTNPTLWAGGAVAKVKGHSKDTLKLTMGFATNGTVPATAEDLAIAFGGTFNATLTDGWIRKGNAWVRTATAPGITKATVDYVAGTITIAASGVDLGAFAAGGNPVVVAITRGVDARAASIRMARTGTNLTY